METIALVLKARQGDALAFTELMQTRQAKLYRIAYSYTKNRDDSLDVVSEVVYRAYVGLGSLRNPAHFDTWLIRIVINQAINHLHKLRRIALVEDTPNIPAGQGVVDTAEAIDLQAAIAHLDANQQTVIILKYFEDLSLAQVAEVMDRPLGTVKTYLHGALKKLRLELKEVPQ